MCDKKAENGVRGSLDQACRLYFASLSDLPGGTRLFLCGAGGKTTCLHYLAREYRRRGYTVLVTTSTHMAREVGICGDYDSALACLTEKGFCFAARPEENRPQKVTGLPEQETRLLAEKADLTIVEADGSRRMPFKVPYPHEPVIYPWITHAAVIYGAFAAGRPVGEIAYNPEGVLLALHEAEQNIISPEMPADGTARVSEKPGEASASDSLSPSPADGRILTEDEMLLLMKSTYGKYFRDFFPGIPVSYIRGLDPRKYR